MTTRVDAERVESINQKIDACLSSLFPDSYNAERSMQLARALESLVNAREGLKGISLNK